MGCTVDDAIAVKQQGRREEALAMLEQAITEGHDPARGWYMKGLTLHELGRADEAIAAYRRALSLRPDYLKALVNLASLHLTAQDVVSAEPLMQQAELLAPVDDWVFRAQRARLNRMRGRVADAIGDAEAAARLAPDQAEVWQELGTCLAGHPRRMNDAITALRRALALNPMLAWANHTLAAVLDNAGKPDQALASATKALDVEPNNPQFQQTLGCVYLHLRRFDVAVPLLRQVLAARPRHFEAHCNLACGLAQTSHGEEAVRHVRRALELVPTPQREAFWAHVPNDPDLAALGALPSFKALFAR